jgi:hypothetical protein
MGTVTVSLALPEQLGHAVQALALHEGNAATLLPRALEDDGTVPAEAP